MIDSLPYIKRTVTNDPASSPVADAGIFIKPSDLARIKIKLLLPKTGSARKLPSGV